MLLLTIERTHDEVEDPDGASMIRDQTGFFFIRAAIEDRSDGDLEKDDGCLKACALV